MNTTKKRIRTQHSNPASGIDFSIWIPISIENNKKNNEQTNSDTTNSSIIPKNCKNKANNCKLHKLSENPQMWDYNSKKKLDYWIEKNTYRFWSKWQTRVLKFLEIMQEKDQSILIITRIIV